MSAATAACLSAPESTGESDISASFVSGEFGQTDLSSLGTVDWAHWGLGGSNDYNHKSGVTPAISSYSQLGDHSPEPLACCTDPFSWFDGTPTTSASDVIGGLMIDTDDIEGDGFQLTVAADTTPQTLTVYVGAFCARMMLEAVIGGDDGAYYSNTSFDAGDGANTAVYTIEFSAGSSGQTLTIDYLVHDNHCTTGDVGEAWMIGATLSR